MTAQLKRGGAREGAGRKSNGATTAVLVHLSAEDLALASSIGTSRADGIRIALRAYKPRKVRPKPETVAADR